MGRSASGAAGGSTWTRGRRLRARLDLHASWKARHRSVAVLVGDGRGKRAFESARPGVVWELKDTAGPHLTAHVSALLDGLFKNSIVPSRDEIPMVAIA